MRLHANLLTFENKIRKISANIVANSSVLSAGSDIDKRFNDFNVVPEISA